MKLRDRFKAWLSRHERLERFWHALWRQRRKIRITIFLVAHLLGALTTVKAIMETRTAQGAVAWAVSLNTIPYVAVPAYWVFGRSDFNGYVTARRTHREELEDFWTDFEETLQEKGLAARKPEDRTFVLEELAKLPVTRGNDAELLIDGDETFDSIIEGIGRAEDFILAVGRR